MTDTLRDRCLDAGADAMGRSSSWRWWAPRHLEKLFDLWEPIIRADERERDVARGFSTKVAIQDAVAQVREQLAADIEARCDRLSHRERIATPPEWPVCAKCMPYFNIARGESDD